MIPGCTPVIYTDNKKISSHVVQLIVCFLKHHGLMYCQKIRTNEKNKDKNNNHKHLDQKQEQKQEEEKTKDNETQTDQNKENNSNTSNAAKTYELNHVWRGISDKMIETQACWRILGINGLYGMYIMEQRGNCSARQCHSGYMN